LDSVKQLCLGTKYVDSRFDIPRAKMDGRNVRQWL
jgi:hypothetical protein